VLIMLSIKRKKNSKFLYKEIKEKAGNPLIFGLPAFLYGFLLSLFCLI